MKYIISACLIMFFVSCSGHKNQLFDKNIPLKSSTISSKTFSQKGTKYYHITSGDRLSVIFYKYPELSISAKDSLGVEVSPDGTVTLPVIKRVKVAGMTKYQLQNFLYKKYLPYLKDPSLKVEVLNKRVYVMGEVKNPGSLDCLKYKSITPIKAIIQRGGLTEFANPHAVKVLRGDRTNYKLMNIDLTDMNSLRAKNIVLQPDDIVYIPHNKAKDFNMPINGISPTLSIVNTIFNSVMTYKALTD